MNCMGFPKIFKGNSTNIITGLDATKECLRLLLSTEVGELFGDPEFGVRVKKYTHNQNNYVLRDIIIDDLFEAINTFCPQIKVSRNDINIEQERNKLYAHIKAFNMVDFTTSTYDLVLLNGEEI